MTLGKKNKKKKDSSGRESVAIEIQRSHILSENSGFYVREAYKALRTNVGFSLADVEGSRVIMVTSAEQSEGKSITAMNFSIALAQDGSRVILLDCDLRRPKQSRLADVSAKEGLSDLLIRPELIGDVIHKFRDNLDMIFAGHVPPNPSELLGSARMQKLLLQLRDRYDYIVLDTPPVNVVTDSLVLSQWVDGVLLVVRAGQTEKGAVTHAVEQLQYVKAKLIGFILNGTGIEAAGYSKYRQYGRYGYRRYGYSRYGYSGYGYGEKKGYGYGYGGYGYGYGYGGYGYGYGYGGRPEKDNREAYEAVSESAAEARSGK